MVMLPVPNMLLVEVVVQVASVEMQVIQARGCMLVAVASA
jgi:hypothetical protein